MRGKVATLIRKRAREAAANDPTRYVRDYYGTIKCTGYRRIYQDMKYSYKHGQKSVIKEKV